MRYLGTWNTPGNGDELNLTNETGRAKKNPTRQEDKIATEAEDRTQKRQRQTGHEKGQHEHEPRTSKISKQNSKALKN